MYLGRYQLGQYVPLAVVCRDGAGTPIEPNAIPRAIIRTTSAEIETIQLSQPQAANFPAVFAGEFYLDSDYAVGQYFAIVSYYASGWSGLYVGRFEIVAGGNAAGTVTSIGYFPWPGAAYVLAQQDGGFIVQGRNPSISKLD